MKYGLLVVSPIENKGKRAFVNIGDMMQTIAIKQLYKDMGISDEDIEVIELHKIAEYCGEYVVLPININLSLNWIIDVFPLPSRIMPVFIGLSYFAATKLPDSVIEFFKQYSPIGCRDENTLNLMREYGIPSYLAGCITLSMTNICEKKTNNIYLVDVPNDVEQYIPQEIRQESRIELVSHICDDENIIYDYHKVYEYTEILLKKYSEAKLVVTSRLHCLSPCLAQQTHVIPLMSNISPRMGWIDKLVNINTCDDLGDIDWKRYEVDINCQNQMRNIAKKRISETIEKYKDICDISFYFENRKRSIYGSYYYKTARCEKTFVKNYNEYIVWGAGQIGQNVCNVLKEIFPEKRMVGIIDSFAAGIFMGMEIDKPAEIAKYKNVFCFIATSSGEEYACDYLKQLGYVEHQNYCSMATVNG